MVSEIVAVAGFVKVDRSAEIIFERLDIAEDGLRCAGKVQVLVQICLTHLFGELGAVRIAILFQLGDQPDQALQLFLSDGPEASFLCVFTLFALNLTPMLGHFASKRKENSKKIALSIYLLPGNDEILR